MSEGKFKPPKELIPVWGLIAVISHQFETETLDQKYKQSCIDQLDELHTNLLTTMDAIEQLANRIQMSMPKESEDDAKD